MTALMFENPIIKSGFAPVSKIDADVPKTFILLDCYLVAYFRVSFPNDACKLFGIKMLAWMSFRRIALRRNQKIDITLLEFFHEVRGERSDLK